MYGFRTIILLTFVILLKYSQGLSQQVELSGQLAGWMVSNPGQSFQSQIGLRYIPELSLEKNIQEKFSFDSELSFNSYGSGDIYPFDSINTGGKIKPYRMWLRFTTPRFEVRAGLQKINFGSATFLRPLMWFDRIDPRDPLQLTDGVYGVLTRYYFLNNSNIWLWGLVGNKDTKGWEFIPSHKKKVEYGGRVQVPLYTGEIAATWHHRQANLENVNFTEPVSSKDLVPENRFGLDGKWDIGIGLWFEGVFIHQDLDLTENVYKRFVNLGWDYTFNLGNGLNVMNEFFVFDVSDKAFGEGEGVSFSALSLNYPLSILLNITAIIYYDWDNKDMYRFLNWQWQFDNCSLYVMGFWNPDKFQIYQNLRENTFFSGKGLYLMAVFNH
ncbi:MAG: hypothetical protein KAX05_07440 [Bacteroidales bacterium]|nr:hypothetical protein [Bacteroidales bacterium]